MLQSWSAMPSRRSPSSCRARLRTRCERRSVSRPISRLWSRRPRWPSLSSHHRAQRRRGRRRCSPRARSTARSRMACSSATRTPSTSASRVSTLARSAHSRQSRASGASELGGCSTSQCRAGVSPPCGMPLIGATSPSPRHPPTSMRCKYSIRWLSCRRMLPAWLRPYPTVDLTLSAPPRQSISWQSSSRQCVSTRLSPSSPTPHHW
mmetsp:Transcript_84792/g.169380  ORF Transcript_84792/g.169380 Transcript_84792/m.169380 type:complete len:207 (+) Transcript_84792:401-1021(+)